MKMSDDKARKILKIMFVLFALIAGLSFGTTLSIVMILLSVMVGLFLFLEWIGRKSKVACKNIVKMAKELEKDIDE